MKASDLFVKALENEGVEYIFGIPGEENLDLLDSISKSTIKMIITRHEQAAGFMAATYGRLTGKTGVCLSTLGPGATNLVTAAAYAQLGGMPMMMITGQKPIMKSKQGQFQIVNIVEMMRPLTKYTKTIVNGNLTPYCIRDAFRISQEERPGAVHIELPEDIAREESQNEIVPVSSADYPVANRASIALAVEEIQKAKMPLLLIGAAANRRATSQALNTFIEKTGIYFFNTQMGKGVVDEHSKHFLGTAALSEHDYIHCAIDRADLIINVGHDIIEKPPFFMHHSGPKVIHINYFPAHIDEVYFPLSEVVGDISTTICDINDKIKTQKHWDFAYYEKIKGEVERSLKENTNDSRFPMLPQRLVHDVRKVLPKNGMLTLDNGIYKIWFARNFKAHNPNSILLDNALASMGAGLPSAIGAAMVYPERKIISICGDGGFMMNSQELETAVRLKLNLVILVLRDNAYGMIKWKQSAMKMQDFGLDFGNPDFVKYAESYGAFGHRIKDTDSFVDELKTCLDKPGVHVVEVPVDYSENVKVLIDELYQKTCLL